MSAMRARMRKEVEMLESDPPYGVSAWPAENRLDKLEAQILGPEGSPYENGTFKLDIEIPERYPFEPPKVQFVTPIFHPNIDDAGRICLDTLKMQPKGSWMPSVNISTLLTTIRLLMAEPNADDGLMPDITDLFKHNRELFNRRAVEHTKQHACGTASQAAKEAKASVSLDESKSAVPSQEKHVAQEEAKATVGAKRVQDDRDSFSDQDDSSDESDFSQDDDEDKGDAAAAAKRQRV